MKVYESWSRLWFKLSYECILGYRQKLVAVLLHPKFLWASWKIISRKHVQKNLCRMRHYESQVPQSIMVQQADEALGSHCKWTQSSESRLFLCAKKYELLLCSLRPLCSNEMIMSSFKHKIVRPDLWRWPVWSVMPGIVVGHFTGKRV